MGVYSKNLKTIMKEKGIAQKRLAMRAGINPTSVNAYVRGERVPAGQTSEKIAEVLGVPEAALYAGTPELRDVIIKLDKDEALCRVIHDLITSDEDRLAMISRLVRFLRG